MQRIVAGVDGSSQADRALAWAVREAELHLADLAIVHCYVAHARGAVMYMPDREKAEARLAEIVDRNRHLLDHVTWSADTIGVFNQPSSGLVDAGEDADLVVVGFRGAGGFPRLRLGSTGYRTAAHAATPVAVIHTEGSATDDGQRSIIVGVDGSRASGRALEWAVDEARKREVPVTVVHTVPGTRSADATAGREGGSDPVLTEAERVVDTALEDVDTTGVTIDRVVERGATAGVLLSRSGGGHVLVIGTHGRSALGRMVFGSVSHQCLHHADGPVVIVP